jgi:fused signal recognition particle receptor
MFEQLKRAFSDAARNISSHREISERDLNNQLSELELSLLESDVAPEVVDDLFGNLRTELLGLELEKGQTAEGVVKLKLRNRIAQMFEKSGSINLIQEIRTKKEAGKGPFVILLLGINGTGKTTTVAKIAHLLKKNGTSVVLAAADTHRAGAIEQLSLHGENISTKVISQRYGADPSAVGRDAVDYAVKHRVDTVLIDTAGRMQTAKNLMDEINKLVRVVKPDIKLFIGDSLTGNDTINQARVFFEYTKFDGAILTKTDADAKGGSAISIVHVTSKPIVLLGVGQGYDDIIPFYSEKFLDSIFGDSSLIDEQQLPSNNIIQQDISKENKIEDQVVTDINVSYQKRRLKPVNDERAVDDFTQGTEKQFKGSSPDSTDIRFSNDGSPIRHKSEESEHQQGQNQYEKEQEQLKEQQQQKQQQQQQQQKEQEQKRGIDVVSDEGKSELNGKKEGGFFRGLFNRKNKTKTKDPEKKDQIEEHHVNNSSKERDITLSSETEKKFEGGHIQENKEKKLKKQQDEEEVVYLTDEDIEDLLK